MKKVDIWTDGSSIRHNDDWYGGAGALLIHGEVSKSLSEPLLGYTNNMSELYAMIMSLRALRHSCEVTLYYDSEYCRKCVTEWMFKWEKNGWKTSKGSDVKNRELIEELYHLTKNHSVKFVKVKAHSGVENNEIVDGLAYEAAKGLVGNASM